MAGFDPSAEVVTELAERNASGESFAEVARDLGIHQGTLRQWVVLAATEIRVIPAESAGSASSRWDRPG